MKGLFWNSRGLGDLVKHSYICYLVKEQHLDFVAILETGKKDFSVACLNHLCGGRGFLWHFSPSQGRSGGILLGVDSWVFDIGSIDAGDFYVKFHLKTKRMISNGFLWLFTVQLKLNSRKSSLMNLFMPVVKNHFLF